MKAHAQHTSGDFQSVVHNSREHSLLVDLPPDLDGDDLGPTALELAGMSLAGCITTIWAKVATNSGVDYEEIHVDLTLDKGDTTVDSVEATVRVDSDASRERLERILDKTMTACPVGRLFEQAGVDMDATLLVTPVAANGVS
jgi:uncharacterized OsmC-like protein